jgi:hypothetical protein
MSADDVINIVGMLASLCEVKFVKMITTWLLLLLLLLLTQACNQFF